MATIYKNNGPVTRKTSSGRVMHGYDVVEYENGHPVYQYTAIYRSGENHMILYPHRAIVKGTRRNKTPVSIHEIEKHY